MIGSSRKYSNKGTGLFNFARWAAIAWAASQCMCVANGHAAGGFALPLRNERAPVAITRAQAVPADDVKRTLVRRLDGRGRSVGDLIIEAQVVFDMVLSNAKIDNLKKPPRLVIGATCESPTSAHASGDPRDPAIKLDRALIWYLYRIAQLDAYIHTRQSDQQLRETAAARYINHLMQHWLSTRGSSRVCDVDDFAKFLGIPDERRRELEADKEFNNLAGIGWYNGMLFSLAHEIAHLQLGHAQGDARDWIVNEIEADNRAEQIVNTFDPSNAVAAGWIRSYITAFFYFRAADNKRAGRVEAPSTEDVIKWCVHTIDVQERTVLGPNSPIHQPGSPITAEEVRRHLKDGRERCKELFN